MVVSLLMLAACGSPSTDNETSSSQPLAAGHLQPTDTKRAPVDPDAPVSTLATGFTDAGFQLMRAQPATENLVFSPLSIGHALLMASGAADDPTAAAITSAFGLPQGTEADEAWNNLDQSMLASSGTNTALDGTPTPILTMADRLWPAVGASPNQGWIDLMSTHHGASVETIDPANEQASRQRINQWVSDQTNQLIPQLLPAGFINPSTVLVLTDAVYFKAQWQSVFGKYGPEVAPFTMLDGSQIEMSYLVDFEQPGPRGAGDGYVGAEIPYLGNDFTMLVIVPEQGRFGEIRSRLSAGFVDEVDATFSSGPYKLQMPEWETTSTIDLLGWLTDLGIAPGSYPGIGPGASLAGAVHGADITVDEIGTEAAAATGMGFETSGAEGTEMVVAADRSFFYLVRHAESGAVLFAGQVTDPRG